METRLLCGPLHRPYLCLSGHASRFTSSTKMAYSTIMTAIQPSGQIHLGNYFGAIQPFLQLQRSDSCKGHPIRRRLFAIADMHALTVPERTAGLANTTLQTAAMLLAAGIDPKRTILFRQSRIPEHQALMWMLLSQASVLRLQRMIQWKVSALFLHCSSVMLCCLSQS